MANPPPKKNTRRLEIALAHKRYLQMFPLKFTVNSKLIRDHFVPENFLSKSTSEAETAKRFARQPTLSKMTWTAVNADKIKNKAEGSSDRAAYVYGGKQQMAVAIKVLCRTVSIKAYTKKDLKGDNVEDYTKVPLSGGDRYLEFHSPGTQLITVCVTGPWDPLSGKVDLYHYDEKGRLPSMVIQDDYLEWVLDEAKFPIYPALLD